MLIAISFALLAALLVKTLAPYACGSGIPEVRYIFVINKRKQRYKRLFTKQLLRFGNKTSHVMLW